MYMQIEKDLLSKIDSVFPVDLSIENHELTFHEKGCRDCDDLRPVLNKLIGKEINGEVINVLHQSLSMLSSKSFLWILPHYMKYCLLPEAEYSQQEAQFLIYNLRPSHDFYSDTRLRLSLLTTSQIDCLIEFLIWCRSRDAYSDYVKDINQAIKFLTGLKN